MIPLRDSARRGSVPLVVAGLIVACVGLQLHVQGLRPESAVREVYLTYGAIPSIVLNGPWARSGITLVASMFLHGGWAHLVPNMLYLWVFGDNIEDAMGHARFLVFYLTTGVLAGLVHALTNASSTVPLVGASGAIAGVLGAYLILYPRSRVMSLVLLLPFVRLMELPAAVVLSVWFALQLAQGLMVLGAPGVTSIAWWAHVGGFAAGIVLARVFARR